MINTLEQKNRADQAPTPLAFEQQHRESSKAFAAFKTYLNMGPNRSLGSAAAKLGWNKRRMERFSQKYDWCNRVEAFDRHFSELERQAIERLVCEKAVEWWQLHEPARRQAWLEAEAAIADVREARERWRKSDRIPGFEGMARMLDLAFKLKQFAAGMPSEIKEVHNLHAGKVSLEWEEAIKKAYAVTENAETLKPETLKETIIDVEEVKP